MAESCVTSSRIRVIINGTPCTANTPCRVPPSLNYTAAWLRLQDIPGLQLGRIPYLPPYLSHLLQQRVKRC